MRLKKYTTFYADLFLLHIAIEIIFQMGCVLRHYGSLAGNLSFSKSSREAAPPTFLLSMPSAKRQRMVSHDNEPIIHEMNGDSDSKIA